MSVWQYIAVALPTVLFSLILPVAWLMRLFLGAMAVVAAMILADKLGPLLAEGRYGSWDFPYRAAIAVVLATWAWPIVRFVRTNGVPANGVWPPAAPVPAWVDLTLALVCGMLAALALFLSMSFWLSGARNGYLWHAAAGLVGLAVVALAVFSRAVLVRFFAAPFGLALVALSAWGGLVFPGIVRASSEQVADGRPYCFVTSRAREGRIPFESYTVIPRPVRTEEDLTLLTIDKRYVGLAVVNDWSPDRIVVTDMAAMPVRFMDWSFRRLAFDADGYSNAFRNVYFDCISRPGYLSSPPDAGLREATLFHLRWTAEADGTETAQIAQTLFRVPDSFAPSYSTNSNGGLRIWSAPPDFDAPAPTDWFAETASQLLMVRIYNPTDDLEQLRAEMYVPQPEGRVDMRGQPVGEFGLHAHLGNDGWQYYASYRDTGQLATAIRCAGERCEHMFVPADTALRGPVAFGYPPDLLPRWKEMEERLTRLFLGFTTAD